MATGSDQGISVGDAVLTFLGDTTQLEASFDNTEARAGQWVQNTSAKMGEAAGATIPVAEGVKGIGVAAETSFAQFNNAAGQAALATVNLQTAQKEFRAALEATSATGGNTVANIQRLAEAENNLTAATIAAREAQTQLKLELTEEVPEVGALGEAYTALGSRISEAFGLIAAYEGFKTMVEHVQESVLQLDNLSRKTNIAVDQLAGLQHEAEKNGVSFDAVSSALTRLSRAQTLAIEGGSQQVQAFKRIGIEVEDLRTMKPEEMFFKVAESMNEAKNAGELNASAFALLGRGGAALLPILRENTEELRKNVDEAARSSGVNADAAKAARDWQAATARLSEEFRATLIPAMEYAVPVIKTVEELVSDTALVIKELATVVGGFGLIIYDQFVAQGQVLKDIWDGNWKGLVQDAKANQQVMKEDFAGMTYQFQQNYQDTVAHIKEIWKEQKPFKPLDDDLSDLTAKLGTDGIEAVLKADMDKALAHIEAWRAAMHQAFVSGQIDASTWAVIQIQTADAVDAAHEKFLSNLVAAYKKAGDAQKANTTQAELDALVIKDQAKAVDEVAKAEERRQEAIKKTTAEFAKLEVASVTKEWDAYQKALDRLTRTEEQLLKAQTDLKESDISASFKKQEDAISQLAAFRLISEQEKRSRLQVLYSEEEADAMKALQDQLTREKSVLDAAQARLTAAYDTKGNPILPESQITDLKRKLDEAEIAYLKTEQAITKTQEKFDGERLVIQKGAIGRAITQLQAYESEEVRTSQAKLAALDIELRLAAARGQDTKALQLQRDALVDTINHQRQADQEKRQSLILDLQLHQAKLTAIKDEIALAQAQGRDVTQMKAAQKQLQNETKEILKQINAVHALGNAWKQFSAGLQSESKENLLTIQDMGVEMQKDMEQFAGFLGAEFAAMIQGQESFGDAMMKATAKLIGQMAEQWGQYYAAKAIADVWDNPGKAAAEFAAAIALFTLGSLLGSLSGGSGSSGAGKSPSVKPSQSVAETGQGTPATPVENVQSFATGGIAFEPMLAIIGDSPSGGKGTEAILPLDDRRSMSMIAETLIGHMLDIPVPKGARPSASELGATLSSATLRNVNADALPAHAASGAVHANADPAMKALERSLERMNAKASAPNASVTVNVQGLVSPDNLKKVMSQMNHLVTTKGAKLEASNSRKVTKRG